MILTLSEDRLERLGQIRNTTVQTLQREGVIPLTGGGSLVQRIRARNRAAADEAAKSNRKTRRAERRQALIEYKRQQNGDETRDGLR